MIDYSERFASLEEKMAFAEALQKEHKRGAIYIAWNSVAGLFRITHVWSFGSRIFDVSAVHGFPDGVIEVLEKAECTCLEPVGMAKYAYVI